MRGPRRREWVRTRLTAKAAVRWATGYHGTEIVTDRDGAPRISGAPGAVGVSLAHTGTLAACAVSRDGREGPLGVDIEPVDVRNAVLLPRLLAPGEPPDEWRELAPGLLATILVTCKEAALKAHRRPSPSLRDYRMWRCPRGRLWVRVAGSGHEDLRVWRSARAGLVTAVCVSGRRTPARRRVTPDHVLAAVREKAPPLDLTREHPKE
ncbi:hypothetical protein DVH02_01880 [Streptomyces corynorhini]|uniref:4'-phosphopantetheinyl transferase N-terminal domain-containing protein n=1 Tax=Streptomyces corynorhini TaxID=2282652 RepID=A0A370BHK7_9ACTN|nr:hypothetical protein DVH02_01880 [Streptomyces corynorhini]